MKHKKCAPCLVDSRGGDPYPHAWIIGRSDHAGPDHIRPRSGEESAVAFPGRAE